MKKIILSILLSAVFAINGMAQNTCSNALQVADGVHIIDTIIGTEIPAVLCATGGSGATRANWYKYTPSQDFAVTITTDFPVNAGIDNRVHVYNGSCGTLSCVAGDDDSGSDYLCVVSLNVTANTDYYIVFDNRWTSEGFQFEIIENPIVIPNPSLISFTATNINTINGSFKNAVADMNGDFLDDIIAVSSNNVQIHYQQSNGTFSIANIPTTTAQFTPSWSIAVADYDDNGYSDLLYGGGSGVTFMRSNDSGTAFTQISGPQYVFSQRSNFVDLNNDGHLDAFVCHDVAPNVYYTNDGNGNLTFNQGGLGDHPNGGNYGSIFIDYDNDGDQDLFIAKCRGGQNTAKINELHRNNGNGTFTNVSQQANLADPIQTWSSAWNDYNNDGWMDVVVGASSGADGMHKFMRNNGDGTFTDITAGSGIDTYAGVSIEYVSYDFNNDGYTDVFTDNTILFNNGDTTFTSYVFPMQVGPVGDLNNDGFLDVQNNNTVYYNNGNSNNWIKLTLEGTVSNRNGIGARVELYGAWGKQIRDVQAGIGFRYMGSLNTHFGIGSATAIDSIIVRWPSGIVDLICNPDTNIVLHVIENSGIAPQPLFTSNASEISEFESVEFTDASSPCPSSWNWTIEPQTGWEFINASTANSQNPTVLFNQAGTYIVSLNSSNTNGESLTAYSDTIIVNLSVGIEDKNARTFSLYPNPAEELLNIKYNKSPIKFVKVVSMIGTEKEVNFSRNSNTINVSHLSPGVYFLNITTETGDLVVSKFLKK